MSLINEALKKAGRDAERAGPRATLAPSPSQVPPRRRSLRIALLALLAIGGGTVFLFVRGTFQSEPEPVAEPIRTAEAPIPSAPDPSPPTAVVALPEVEATEPASEDVTTSTPIAAAAPEVPAAAPVAQPPPEDSAPRVEKRARRPRRATAPETTPTPVQDAGSPLDGASFLKRAQIPGGGSLELSGIAWSETQPVAVISGSVVSPGERVKGFKVLRIRPDSVDLEGENEIFTLRLK
jgi:hypothetical protein